MQDMNHVSLIGRLASDPELKNMNSGKSRLDINFVFNTTKKDGERWIDEGNFTFISVWGKQAESLSAMLHKGSRIAVDGHLHVDTWEKDGKKQSVLKVMADNIYLLDGNKKEDATVSEQETFIPDGEDIPF